MFDIVSEAAAQSIVPGVDLPGLGPYPILQLFGGIAVLAIGLFMWMRGEREGQRKKADPTDSEVHMHFDGPMVEALKCLREIADAAKQIPEAAKIAIGIREDLIRRIDETRHGSRNELQREVGESERKLELIEQQVGKIATSLAHLEGRLAARSRDR